MDDSVFDVPEVARSASGAYLFGQHSIDLSWAIGQEYLVRQYEELTSIVVDSVRKLTPEDLNQTRSGKLRWDEEIPDFAAIHFEDRAKFVRSVVNANHDTISRFCRTGM